MMPSSFQSKVFLWLLMAVSLAFLAILWPLYEAIFWGVTLAIIFSPLHRRLLLRMPGRPNAAALATLALCLVVAILPMVLLGASLIQEASHVYERLRTGQLDMGNYFEQIMAALPAWVVGLLDRLGLLSVAELQQKLSSAAVQGGQFIATRALNIGQNTFQFLVSFGIMLYLLFFLLRDGRVLGARIRNAIPLQEHHKRDLSQKFTTVIRATVKGNIVVAATQGMLGGFIFWALSIQGPVLWGVLMAFFVAVASHWRGLDLDSGGDLFFCHRCHLASGDADGVCRGRHWHGRQHAAPHLGRQRHQDAGLCGADFDAGRHVAVWLERFCDRSSDCRAVHRSMGSFHLRKIAPVNASQR